jgi:hypothetical protein
MKYFLEWDEISDPKICVLEIRSKMARSFFRFELVGRLHIDQREKAHAYSRRGCFFRQACPESSASPW